MRTWLVLGMLLVAVALVPAQAGAATVRVLTVTEENEEPPLTTTTLLLDSTGGRFRGQITRSGGRYTIAMRRGRLRAGDECRRVNRRRAVCDPSRPLDVISATLSPRPDSLAVAIRRLGAVQVVVGGEGGNDRIVGPGYRRRANGAILLGGPGRDVLAGGNGADQLGGGPGRDRLAGHGGRDNLDDMGSGRRSNRDVLDGGRGRDTVGYAGRTRAVTVDLAHRRGGRGSERDKLLRIEDAYGSQGGDLMIGSRGANRFDGGDGDDRLRGGRGNDVLAGGVGSAGGIDRFSGGPGSDRIESEDDEFNQDPETINCGTGNDRVDSSDPGDRAADDCERALLKDGSGGTAGTVSIHPRVEGGTATFHLVCTRPAGARCVGAVRVNEAQTDYDVAPGEADVAVTLSAADAAQLAADGRLDARLAAAGEFYATWTATLR